MARLIAPLADVHLQNADAGGRQRIEAGRGDRVFKGARER
jgi:hypothetical protein